MAEDNEIVSSRAAGDAAAVGIAMNADAATAEPARAYLHEQTELAKLQKQNLLEQNAFELSHLRWRRFNDQMKGAVQIMIVLVGLLILAALAATVWNASQADGIVVEAFSVPPGFAADGLSGDVVADDLTNKIAGIRDAASGNSFARSKDVRNARDEDVKVEIPETGISFAQAWRYLKAWLGHERPLRGNIRRTTDGKIALTVALTGDNAVTFTGPPSDLDRLEQQAAEHVFAGVDPSNYVLYLDAMGREHEAYNTISQLAQSATDPIARSGFTSLWAAMTRGVLGDIPLSLARARYSLQIFPRMMVSHREIMAGAKLLGHDEEALAEAQTLLTTSEQDYPASFRGHGFSELMGEATIEKDVAAGDFQRARNDPCFFYCSSADALLQRVELDARVHDTAESQADIARALALGNASATALFRARLFADEAAGNWNAADDDAKAYGDAILATAVGQHHTLYPVRYAALKASTFAAPLRAYALARTGDFTAAEAAINVTPRDCYLCMRTRGMIAGLEKTWSAAAVCFEAAAKQGPSLPFAYADWGEMLLHRGDYNAAIEKFREANLKGPHFADPLEMWGEALMAKNRSDLALAKFEEANKYAPSWGRLHLKWGEALMSADRKDDARKQFTVAERLDLSPTDLGQLHVTEKKLQ
jgi:tetratricopeptide (TPR) repeat protein